MGRLPSNGAPAFRFIHTEVAQMEAIIQEHQGQVPSKEFLTALAEKFSNSPERAGKVAIQMKQVWSWFQNRRFALRSKTVKTPRKLNISPVSQEEVGQTTNVAPTLPQVPLSSGHNVVSRTSENPMEFEAKSAKDGAWYDVQSFISHRYLETGNPEVKVRFAGVWPEEEEWVNIRKHVRQRSLPCEAAECVAVLAGDLILCFQEGKEQALYFDAHVLDAQRRRHDVRGCRCRFLVRYDHDQSEEIVPLRKICRRPETDYRLHLLNATKEASSVSGDPLKHVVDPTSSNSSNTVKMTTPNPSATAVPIRPAHMSPATALSPAPVPTPALAPVSTTTMVPGPSSSHFVQVSLPSQKAVESNKPEEALIGRASTEASLTSSEPRSTVTISTSAGVALPIVNVKSEPGIW